MSAPKELIDDKTRAKVERQSTVAVEVQVLAKLGTDYRLIQHKEGLIEIVYNNGNWVGNDMQGRLLHALFELPVHHYPCQKCEKRIATSSYSSLKVCIWCSDRLNDEFDEEYR